MDLGSFEDWLALNQLYADHAHAVDAGQWDRWTEVFTDDCVYRVRPRENHERGFPLATLAQQQGTALRAVIEEGLQLALCALASSPRVAQPTTA